MFTLKLDLYALKTYKYTKDKNLVSNQYTLFDLLRFSHILIVGLYGSVLIAVSI